MIVPAERPLRAVVIGCGRIGAGLDGPGIANHAAAYATSSHTELVAVSDSDASRGRSCAVRWKSVPAYDDFRTLLREQRPELVSVCTPDATHYDIVRQVIRTVGVRAVLAEKPLATTVDQAAELVREAELRGVVLAVNYSRRYLESHARLRQLIEAGGIGVPRVVRGLYINGTLHNGTHWFDLIRYLLGEVKSVRGFDRLGEVSPDPTLDVALELTSGAIAELHACRATEFDVFEMDIIGTDGRLRITDGGAVIEHFAAIQPTASLYPYRDLVLKERIDDPMSDLLLIAVEDLVSALDTGMPRCTGHDAVAALEIAVAATTAARTGDTVHLNAGRWAGV